MKIGVRAHDYGKKDIEELAIILNKEGYEAVQLALPKAFNGIECYEDITYKHLMEIRYAFEKKNIDISVFGCYMDLGNPDEKIRTYAVETIKKCLLYCKEVGAKMVGTETAYPRLDMQEKRMWYPYMLDSIKRIMEEAVRIDVKFAIEPVYWHPLDSIENVLHVMETIGDEKHLRMIFDASNLLHNPQGVNQELFWNDWLENTGKYIDVMHIKDFILDQEGQYCPVQLGKGIIQYQPISNWLHNNKTDIYLLREEMNPVFSRKDIEFLKKI